MIKSRVKNPTLKTVGLETSLSDVLLSSRAEELGPSDRLKTHQWIPTQSTAL